ncbi:hypothetical protein BJ508DRAFT_307195 [Ascobolus immersus RN42]|uniref:Uncharacterized protein n=1 Tax=Ascobolus immersus RN42 TaxID=1160509 RepID=A0A3N4I9F6_ASCIM|nr:hypothetical protein BJ508DRAFT_307195 [Ascobolus immersus RN42]
MYQNAKKIDRSTRRRHYEQSINNFKLEMLLEEIRRVEMEPKKECTKTLELLVSCFMPSLEQLPKEVSGNREISKELNKTQSTTCLEILSRYYNLESPINWESLLAKPFVGACRDGNVEFVEACLKILTEGSTESDENSLGQRRFWNMQSENPVQALMLLPLSNCKSCAGMTRQPCRLPHGAFSNYFGGGTYRGISFKWESGKEGLEKWRDAMKDLLDRKAKIALLLADNGFDFDVGRTSPISTLLSSVNFHTSNCISSNAPNSWIKNKYTWVYTRKLLLVLLEDVGVKISYRQLDGWNWGIIKWAVIFPVREKADPRERVYGLRIVELLAGSGLFIDWESVARYDPFESAAYMVEDWRKREGLIDLQEGWNGLPWHLTPTVRKYQHPLLITVVERWGEMWQDIEDLPRRNRDRWSWEMESDTDHWDMEAPDDGTDGYLDTHWQGCLEEWEEEGSRETWAGCKTHSFPSSYWE